MARLLSFLRLVPAFAAAALLFAPAMARAQAIRNVATLSYAGPTGEVSVLSNAVTADRALYVTRISFRRLPVGFTIDHSQLRCEPEQGLRFTPQPVSATELAKAEPLESYDIDDPAIFVVESWGSNYDPDRIDSVEIVGKSGGRQNHVLLYETGPDTGIFAGAVPPSTRNSGLNIPCDITADNSGHFTLWFAGDRNSTEAVNTILIDPEGHVFDSETGAPIDGAVVTLIDDATGQPAQVFGDDGVSSYPNTVVTGAEVTDSGGWVYNPGTGKFRFPLVAAGRYRLLVKPPVGYGVPSQRPPAELMELRTPAGKPFQIGDGSYGKPFDVMGRDPITVDVPADHKQVGKTLLPPSLVLAKQASTREAMTGDIIEYRLELRNAGGTSARNIVVADALPRGLRYRIGTTRGVAEPILSADGRSLRFRIADLVPRSSASFTYLVEVAPSAPIGEAVNHATASAGSLSSNQASAPVRIRAMPFADAFTMIGRVTEGACGDPAQGRKGVADVRLLLDDGSYVVSDKDGFYHFEGVAPGTHVVQVDRGSIPPTHEPVSCDVDTRGAGSAISRFVDGKGGSLERVDFQLRPTGRTAAVDNKLPVTPLGDAEAAGSREDWLDRATSTPGWLFPDANHNPRAPALRVVIQHKSSQRVALWLNGKLVDPLSFDGSDNDRTRDVAISRWTGLVLKEGDNLVEARILEGADTVVALLTRTVHYANTPARAEYVADKSRLVADGLTRPLIAVSVTDRDGRPVRAGTPVPFRVDPPYQAEQQSAAQQARQLAGLERAQAMTTVVGDDGLAFLALQPTRQAGLARITATLADHEGTRTSEIRAWLAAPARDWVVVGFGKGTLGYDMLSGAERLAHGAARERVTDGQLSLYAKGRIKGAWLLTLAYDSDKSEERLRERGRFGTIDPDRYYTVYGDGTLQGQDAASRRKLYVRLDRREFYALYGDFETGLVDTRLARYNRTLSGVKAEYTGKMLRFTAFAAHDDSRFGHDEIQGNGLSGPYRLSAGGIVPNSDKLRLETRNRLSPDRVLDAHNLTRHIDYDIDYDTGTLRFREPILSRDSALNPQFIVTDYETWGERGKRIAGGRAAARIGKAEIGASVLHDEAQGARATLLSVDLRAHVDSRTEVRAEAATGGPLGAGQAQGYLAEVEHHGSRADLLVYARQQDRDFGLGQQNFGEAGARRAGLDGRVKLSERWQVAGSAWYQESLTEAAHRLASDVRVEYRRSTGTLHAGVQLAADRTGDGQSRMSQLLTFGGTQNLLGNRLQLSAEAQLPVGGKNDSVDFPARQTIGAAWRFKDGIKLIGGYEVARGEAFVAQTARVGFDLAPWKGGRLLATLNQGMIGENGARSFAQYGLSQSLPVGKRWTIDATLDSSSTLSGQIPANAMIHPFGPATAGSGAIGTDGLEGDFIAVTFGATYRGDRWSWNGRTEYRDSARERRWGLTSNLLRTLGQGSTLASNLRIHRLQSAGGGAATSVRGDLAFALRPVDGHWSLLERLELRSESAGSGVAANNAIGVATLADGVRTTLRAINNFAVNYRSGSEGGGHAFEASLYHGAKYVRGRYSDERFDGFIQVLGLSARQDLTSHFDVGIDASAQHSLSTGTVAFALGGSASVSPVRNLAITAGYNLSGYRDRDFEAARWSRKGPYLTMRFKFDEGGLRDLVRPIFGGGR